MADRRLVIDTDTATDDAQALVLAALSERLDLEGVTVVAGNVAFDHQVENAKYALDLAGAADVPVHEGARSPLLKDYETAEYVHGDGGLGGELFPDTGIPSADQHAVDYIVETARENPGEVTLACIGPLTNLALALKREPDLDDLLADVWVMGGNRNCLGNVTPAAEFNFWVDPDAAKLAVRELEVTLIDWGVTLRDSLFHAGTLDSIADAAADSKYAEFYTTMIGSVRSFNRETLGRDAATQPDSLVVAGLIEPDLIESAGTYHVDVDEREGLTRGYTLVDENGVTDGEARTRVVESIDADGFRQLFLDAMRYGDPERSLT